jgi:all-trans-8'-apo-beta-carotenal 15,15'-oxygenase
MRRMSTADLLSTVTPRTAPAPTPARLPTSPTAAKYTPAWLGGFQDLAREHAFEPLLVTGKLPAELRGSFYRNGPGRFGVAGERFGHWFDGDGAVCAVRLEGGRALGAARLVQTRGLERERRAGKRLYGGYGTPLARPLREVFLGDSKNAANTSVLLWQGRLFATCEAGKPHEVSTDDLSTLGEEDLGGVVVGAFSAHPHYVPARRCAYNFGISHGRSTRIDAYALPDGGPARRITSFRVDGARMNHDFAATARNLVFVFVPMHLSLWQMVVGRKSPVGAATWHPEQGAEIVVVPIDEPSKIRRFRVDAFFLEHVVNAFEEGGKLIVDYTHYANPQGLEGFVAGLVHGRVDAPLGAEIRRATIDVERGTLSSEVILGRAVELPRVSPRVEAERHRFAYYAGFTSRVPDAPFDAVLKQDLDSGRVDAYVPGARQYPGEGVFVPRPAATAEDDGWVLTVVYDSGTDRSRLDVLDARAVGDGPVASCHFDQALPFGFHGAWAPA